MDEFLRGVDREAADSLAARFPPGPDRGERRVGEDLRGQADDLLDSVRLRELPEIRRDLDGGEHPTVREVPAGRLDLQERGHGYPPAAPVVWESFRSRACPRIALPSAAA